MIVVCGEALVDVIDNGEGSRQAIPGGGPFNTARALARLGVPAAFLGRLSSDALGRRLADALIADGVSLVLAPVGPEPTTLAIAKVDSGGLAEYEFVIEKTSAPNLTPDMVPERLNTNVSAIHIGTLGLVLEPMASTLVELVRRESRGRMVILDPNIRTGLVPDDEYRRRIFEMVALSAVVKASVADLAWLYPRSIYESAADQLVKAGVRLVVVTLGSEGAYAVHGRHRARVGAVPVDVVDTIGAGDAFGAALMAWLHDHNAIKPDVRLDAAQLHAALEYACLAAALTCGRPGAEPPSRDEMAAASEKRCTDG